MAAREGCDPARVFVTHDPGPQLFVQLHQLEDADAAAVPGPEACLAARATENIDSFSFGSHGRACGLLTLAADDAHEALRHHGHQ